MKDMTLINVILDRSGSMSDLGIEVVGMFNSFLEEQKKLEDYAELSLIQFDSYYQEDYLRKPIKKCENLILGKTYIPRSMTALYDAIGKSIYDVGISLNSLKDEDKPKRVLFIIITDGFENASTEFNKEKIKEMIDHQKEKYDWDFIFMAAGIDAFDEGNKFGMDINKCASFDNDVEGINSLNSTINSYTAVYRSTGDSNMDINSYKRNI